MKKQNENGKVFGTLAFRVIRFLLAAAAVSVAAAAAAGYFLHAISGAAAVFLLLFAAAFLYAGTLWVGKYLLEPYRNSMALFRRFTRDEAYQELLESPYQIFEEQRGVLKHFDSLLDQKSMIQLSTKQAEFLALQNQINPHFLYNTLEAIRGDALCAGLDSIANTTEALATFFRYTITETGTLVTVQDELDNIDNYFKIQQYRFGDKFTMRVDFPAESEAGGILSLKLPKLTLQPFVENAIFHGLESKAEGGNIDISFEKSDFSLYVSIRDDGVGIPEEKLQEINYRLEHVSPYRANPEQKGGIALLNVARRIRLLFGENYGFHIYSIRGMGTDVRIKIPVIR